MTIVTVAFLKKGYIEKMSLEEYNKLTKEELEDTMVLSMSGFDIYVSK